MPQSSPVIFIFCVKALKSSFHEFSHYTEVILVTDTICWWQGVRCWAKKWLLNCNFQTKNEANLQMYASEILSTTKIVWVLVTCCPGFFKTFYNKQLVLPHTKIRSQAGTKEKGKENKGNESKRKKWRRKQTKITKWWQISNTYALPLLMQWQDIGWNFNNLVKTAFYSALTMEGLSSKNCLDSILNPYHSRKGTLYLPAWQNVTLIWIW